MEIYKNNTLVQTITLDTDSDIHAHNLTDLNLDYGFYKACLCDSKGNRSGFTYWEILETNVSSVLDNHDILSVYYSSANAKPTRLVLCSSNGKNAASLELTEAEILSGSVSFNLYDLYKKRVPDKAMPTPLYLKVYFKGEYGIVTNSPLVVFH